MQQGAAAGLGVTREQLIEGSTTVLTQQMDDVIKTYADDGLTVSPILGIPPARKGPTYVQDAATEAGLAKAFAQRFGPGGAYWSEHPDVPAHPVTQIEIGNEPNTGYIPPGVKTGDEVNLHFATPAEFALVYKTARAALKALHPDLRVIVGGMAPEPLADDEAWLAGFLHDSGPVDAIGWHPYVGLPGCCLPNVASLYSWTMALRDELNNLGFASTAIDVNEVDGASTTTTSAQWGADMAAFTRWAICAPAAGITDVQPEWWGGKAGADANLLFPLAHDNGTLSDYGRAYLAETHQLTTTGCPA